jgi:hypothetical protein
MDPNALDDDLGKRLCHGSIIAPNKRNCCPAVPRCGQGAVMELGFAPDAPGEPGAFEPLGLAEALAAGVLVGLSGELIKLPLSIQ